MIGRKEYCEMAREQGSGAFTRIEVIVSLTILAFIASLLISFLGRVMERSSDTVVNLGEAYDLQGTLESIRLSGSTNRLSVLSALIGAEGSSQNNAFGKYRVVHNRPIRFSSNSEQSDPGGTNLLKVTVGSYRGELLTVVLREKTR